MREKMLKASVTADRYVRQAKARVREMIVSTRGEGYIDSVIKMAIAVVIGGFILLALINIIGEDENSDGLLGTINEALTNMFDQRTTTY